MLAGLFRTVLSVSVSLFFSIDAAEDMKRFRRVPLRWSQAADEENCMLFDRCHESICRTTKERREIFICRLV